MFGIRLSATWNQILGTDSNVKPPGSETLNCKMSSKKVSEVSVIIPCQDEAAGSDLTTDEYDKLVKVENILLIFSVLTPPAVSDN